MRRLAIGRNVGVCGERSGLGGRLLLREYLEESRGETRRDLIRDAGGQGGGVDWG